MLNGINVINVEFFEDGSRHQMGYTDPKGNNEQGIADDIVFDCSFGPEDSAQRGEKNFLRPISGTPNNEVKKWDADGNLRSVLHIIYKYGVKMHKAFYDEMQAFYDAVQASNFDENVILNYWG
jgi:hypothetical protein